MTTPGKTLLGRRLELSAKIEKLVGQPASEKSTFERAERAILFTDIVGSTAYFETYGDEAGLAMVERHNRLLIPIIEVHGGRLVKTIGDALMASFPAAPAAVGAAVAMQKALHEYNRSHSEEQRIRVRIGINFGEVLLQGNDVFGDTVNAAARIESLAGPGTILVSASVRAALGASPPACVPFDAVLVKGKSEPLEIFEVAWNPEARPPVGPRPVASAGDVIGGRFRVLGLLGEGGMGQVFRAHDGVLDEKVALKFIRPTLSADSESLERFKQEVKLARAVTHQNVCRIHEFLQMDGHIFLSMELVEGESLEQVIQREAPLAPERVLQLAAGLCAGLAAAHRRGVVHQDLKPANVIVERASGRPVITDFGIARLAGPQEQKRQVAGTPEYMAPEQAQGLAAGPAADIYSLGCLLYELLAGRPPFQAASSAEILRMHLEAEPIPLDKLVAGLDPVLAGAVMRCLEKNPARRFSSAGELARALGLEAETPVRLRVARLATAVALLVVLAGAAYLLLRGPQPPGGARIVEPLLAGRMQEMLARFSPDGRQLAFVRENEAWLTPYPQLAPARLYTASGEIAGLSWSWDSRKLWLTEFAETGPRIAQLELPGASVTPAEGAPADCPVDLSPDGRLLAGCRKNQHGTTDLELFAVDGSERRSLLAGDPLRSFDRPRWGPNGKAIALVVHWTGFRTSRDIALVETATGKLALLTYDGAGRHFNNTDPTWSADGRWIVYSSRRGGVQSLWCVPSAGGASYPLSVGATAAQLQPELFPDGSQLVFQVAEERQQIVLADLNGSERRPIGAERWQNRFPVWSPDGRRLAMRSLPGEDEEEGKVIITVIDLDEDAELTVPAPPGTRDLCWCGARAMLFTRTAGKERSLGLIQLDSGEIRTLVSGFTGLWSPHATADCRRIVFAASQGSTESRRIFALEGKGSAPRPLTGAGESAMYPALSPDGQRVAFRWAPSLAELGLAELRLVPFEGGRSGVLTSHASFRRSQRRLRWSSDGRRVFYLEADGAAAVLWEVQEGRMPRRLKALADLPTFDFDISGDGSRLVYPVVQKTSDIFVMKNIEW